MIQKNKNSPKDSLIESFSFVQMIEDHSKLCSLLAIQRMFLVITTQRLRIQITLFKQFLDIFKTSAPEPPRNKLQFSRKDLTRLLCQICQFYVITRTLCCVCVCCLQFIIIMITSMQSTQESIRLSEGATSQIQEHERSFRERECIHTRLLLDTSLLHKVLVCFVL